MISVVRVASIVQFPKDVNQNMVIEQRIIFSLKVMENVNLVNVVVFMVDVVNPIPIVPFPADVKVNLDNVNNIPELFKNKRK